MSNQPKQSQNSNEKQSTQPTIGDHSAFEAMMNKTQFEAMMNEGLRCSGLHLVASKGFGKSRLLFSMADYCRTLEDSRVFIFDGSDSWLYGFSQIPVFNVCESDITASNQKHSLETEHYCLNNWQLVQTALNSHNDILFRLKTKKPSKRGFFIRTVINYLDDIQRQQIEQSETHQPLKQIAYFIEEAQDCLNQRLSARIESEEFLTVFNEARNQKQAFFTASQRLNDFSKTIRTKQSYIIGKLNSEDITPQIRRIEKLYNVDLTTLPLRTWFYNGETFVSPQWTQNKKPFIVNQKIREEFNLPAQSIEDKINLKHKKGILRRIIDALTTQGTSQPDFNGNDQTQSEESNEDSEDEKENKEMDDMFLLNP